MIDPIESGTMKIVYWRLIPLIFVMMFINYLDRINIGFAALKMNKDLGFNPAVFGFAGSVFFFGYMILGVPSNLVLHRVGARRWIAGILITWGMVATVTAFVWNDYSFYVLRFSLGLMEAGFLPGVAVYLTHWFPERYRGRAVGGYIIAGSFAAVLGGPISTAIMTYAHSFGGLQGWQWMFILEGIPAVVLGLLTLRLLVERPSEARWLAVEQSRWPGCSAPSSSAKALTAAAIARSIWRFASETIGEVQGIDPETGHYFDDTKRYIDAVPWLDDADRQRIYEDNARTVYGRLNAQLARQLA